jgi:hypothetical protein
MYHKAADVRTLLMFPLLSLGFALLFVKLGDGGVSFRPASISIDFPQDGSRVELITAVATEPRLQIMLASGKTPLLGRVEVRADRLIFVPTLPFTPGQKYRAVWVEPSGMARQAEFEIHLPKSKHPTVQMQPGSALPANALKFYLHFSQPMEQDVFLERLKLLDANGKEVIGPFRETELWSPDGKRLTIWFHPGRQKTGVNLNEDEGPVLRANSKHTLVVAGSWRSTSGMALGDDVRFDFQVGQADHDSPKVTRWQIQQPKVGTREPLQVEFDEALDPAMLTSALQVWRDGNALTFTVSNSGKNWSAEPQQPWTAGTYELRADPLLEDLAGNNLTQPFEVDLQSAPAAEAVLKRDFVIE